MLTQTLAKGFVVRHPTMEDIEAVVKLMRACEIALEGTAETTLDDMRLWWTEPDTDIAKDVWVVLSPTGEVVATSSIGHQEHVRIYSRGNVLPAYQGQGIGSHLLSLNEARAKEHVTLAETGARVAMLAQVNAKNIAVQRLLEKNRYKDIRSFWRMGIELQKAPPAPVWPEGIVVSNLAADTTLLQAVHQADNDAFRDHWGYLPMSFAAFEHFAVKTENFDPRLWFIALDGDEISGVCLCADEKESGGWVHSLGIRRQWRRRGLGLAFLYHAFGAFYRRGIHNVYLGVDAQSLTGATHLYERAGMHVVKQYKTYEKELRPGRELSTQSVEL